MNVLISGICKQNLINVNCAKVGAKGLDKICFKGHLTFNVTPTIAGVIRRAHDTTIMQSCCLACEGFSKEDEDEYQATAWCGNRQLEQHKLSSKHKPRES